MTATKPKSPRAGLIAAVHAAKKTAGLDDDTYRAMLAAQISGKTSAKDCTDAELRRVLDHLNGKGNRVSRAGTRPPAKSPHAGKIRALWISLYNLGIVRDPSEKALAAYVKRQVGVDALQWLAASEAFRAIEALKDWATREAEVIWTKDSDPRRDVLRAQWTILTEAAAAPALDMASFGETVTGKAGLSTYTNRDLDHLIEALGERVRKVKEPS